MTQPTRLEVRANMQLTDEQIKLLWQKANGSKPDGVLFHMVRDFAAELLSASKPAAPEGWKLVPVEPTKEMRSAASSAASLADVWAGMLAASPAAPAQSTEPVASNQIQPQGIVMNQAAALAFIDQFEIVGDNNDSRDPTDDEKFVLREFVLQLFDDEASQPSPTAQSDFVRTLGKAKEAAFSEGVEHGKKIAKSKPYELTHAMIEEIAYAVGLECARIPGAKFYNAARIALDRVAADIASSELDKKK